MHCVLLKLQLLFVSFIAFHFKLGEFCNVLCSLHVCTRVLNMKKETKCADYISENLECESLWKQEFYSTKMHYVSGRAILLQVSCCGWYIVFVDSMPSPLDELDLWFRYKNRQPSCMLGKYYKLFAPTSAGKACCGAILEYFLFFHWTLSLVLFVVLEVITTLLAHR